MLRPPMPPGRTERWWRAGEKEKQRGFLCFVFVCLLFLAYFVFWGLFFCRRHCRDERKIKGNEKVNRIGVHDVKLLKNKVLKKNCQKKEIPLKGNRKAAKLRSWALINFKISNKMYFLSMKCHISYNTRVI